jgi:hypothetical protein
MTGVVRPYCGKGVATLLKLRDQAIRANSGSFAFPLPIFTE